MATWTNPIPWVANVKLLAAQLETYVRDNLNYLKEKIGKGVAVELTLSDNTTGSITVTQAYHKIDTLADAPTGNLVSIAGVSQGDIIILRAENDARTVVLKAAGGNLVLGGDIYLDDTNKHVALICDSALNLHLLFSARDVTFMVDVFQYPAPGTDWTPDITGATLAANKAAKKCWLPLNFLKIGDQIVSYNIVGDMVEAGGETCTFDCKLVRVNQAHPLIPTSVSDVAGGGITQVIDDGNFDSPATLTTLETVATDKQYLLELLGTTSNVSGNEFIKVMGAEVIVRRLV